MKQYPNFDGIVFCYDFLKKMVFGNKVDKAQVEFLSYIPKNASVLIIGGGTGEILLKVLELKGVKEITYLEYSVRMIAAAKRRVTRARDAGTESVEIKFVKGSVEKLNPEENFDAVLSPFVLDVIEPASLSDFMRAINKHVRPAGIWLFSDFCKPSSYNLVSYYHKFLIKGMFLFFYFTTDLRGKTLPDFDNHFLRCGYSMLASKRSYNGLIQSKVWQKVL